MVGNSEEIHTWVSLQIANMKIIVALLVGVLALAACNVVKEQKVADKEFVKKQRDILLILKNINQPSYYKEFVEIGNTYNISQHHEQYSDQEVFEQFVEYYNYGMLPRGQIFSVFYQNHLEQAVILSKLLYYAKDYQTFYNTAVFARQNLNEGLFLYSFTVAVSHRPDTHEIVLPPIYEIYPYYFFSTEVIQQAYIYKQQYTGHTVEQGGYNGYTIQSNFSGYYLNLHPEQSLSYYLEDVGISSFYYYYNIYNPFWISSQEFGFQHIDRGAEYYFFYQQLLARYYLERISNGFGEIPYVTFDTPVETSYYPSLEYPNGLEFPSRPQFANVDQYYYTYGQSSGASIYGYSNLRVHDYERRINDAIDSGYIFAHGKPVSLYSDEGLNILGNLIQANQDSPNYNYYGALWLYASHLLGYSYQPLTNQQIAPSVLEHFETALRDPIFYQLYKRVVLKFQRYFLKVPPYLQKDLVFPGVTVTGFNVDSLITYHDDSYFDLSNAVYYTPEEQQKNNFNVRVHQYRLNNKPFTYKINVQSQQETQAVVKVFLGPKNDEYGRYINLTSNRYNMVLIDYFVQNLKSGENVITRNSYDSQLYGPDVTSYSDLYRQVMGAYEGQQTYQYGTQNYYLFPQRYMLPKGSVSGVPYQFYVIVYPYVPQKVQHSQSSSQVYDSFFYPYVGEQQFYDTYSLGYPFDRFIRFEQLFYQVPNSYFYDVTIYHKENVNVVQTD